MSDTFSRMIMRVADAADQTAEERARHKADRTEDEQKGRERGEVVAEALDEEPSPERHEELSPGAAEKGERIVEPIAAPQHNALVLARTSPSNRRNSMAAMPISTNVPIPKPR